MGYLEAKADGIRMEKSRIDNTMFFPPCRVCGVEVYSQNYIRGRNYRCKDCKALEARAKRQRAGRARMRQP